MVYNKVEEIKNLLMLESENQTLSDDDIETYIADANEEMIDELRRAIEIDYFTAEDSGTLTFFPYFNVSSITSIKVDDVVIPASRYSLVYSNDGVAITLMEDGDKVEIYYIPKNYKLLERAMSVVNIMTRLNPFTGEQLSPVYLDWREKRKNYLRIIKGKFGTGKYAG